MAQAAILLLYVRVARQNNTTKMLITENVTDLL